MSTDRSPHSPVVEPRIVAVATDGSDAAARAVTWAGNLAGSQGMELHAIRVLAPATDDPHTDVGVSRAQLDHELSELQPDLHIRPLTVASDDVAGAIVDAAEQLGADVLVVGNSGMRGRKEFLLGNVANRVTHLARCTVIVVNTHVDEADGPTADEGSDSLRERSAEIARVLGPSIVRALSGRVLNAPTDPEGPRRLREALEQLGPTFGKLGQILSTRPDLIPTAYAEELAALQADVPPMTEAEVVSVMEQELQVPWEDVFATIDPRPLAAGTIGQVHRATLADGHRVVVKVQRPTAADLIEQDLVLLERLTLPLARAPRVRRIIDLPSVVEQLGASLRSEVDFTLEADNLDRMAESLARYPRLGVPQCHRDLSTPRLLVMDEVDGVPLTEAPEGPARSAAARELLHAFYQQVLEDGFFHADPHPGNLMWGDDRIWLLDLGMVGRLDRELRQQLTLLLLAFAQGDVALLADLALDMAGGAPFELDRESYEAALARLVADVRGRGMEEIQFADLLDQLTDISIRHGVPLPSSLVMVGKAIAQVQLSVVQLAPELDPLAEAGRFFVRSLARRLASGLDPQALLFQAEKLRYRAGRVADGVTRMTAGGPGGSVDLRFASPRLEQSVARAGRTIALGLGAGLTWIATTLVESSSNTSPAHKRALRTAATGLTVGLLGSVASPWSTRRSRIRRN